MTQTNRGWTLRVPKSVTAPKVSERVLAVLKHQPKLSLPDPANYATLGVLAEVARVSPQNAFLTAGVFIALRATRAQQEAAVNLLIARMDEQDGDCDMEQGADAEPDDDTDKCQADDDAGTHHRGWDRRPAPDATFSLPFLGGVA